ncbi:putative nuclease HARBI1 isoform X2 [Acyrthosiphon pisum]|uniref:DDE Tnp4 domain-containing protein n=1 Tax=Acyrthosiphon pisum TaxID=7029 RepID=A0A8R2JWN1_ACYPI|nr:putative nuclease HARBI1 isoform X2 [Acyrthosiphon pisum]
MCILLCSLYYNIIIHYFILYIINCSTLNSKFVNMENFEEMANLFAIQNMEMQENVGLTKDLTRYLIELLSPFVEVKSRSSAIDLSTKVLIALNFFGTGSYQSPVGYNIFNAVSQPSVSRCVKEIVDALNQPQVINTWVKFPSNIQELNQVRDDFYRTTGFPGVIGCIDCTHVAIVPPSTNLNLVENHHPEYLYINRKNYHSINVQLICDSKLKILNVNALFPGSTHDNHIWNNSNVLPVVQELHERNLNDYYLLGDSGYPLRQWLLTPILNPSSAAEIHYNTKQMCTRSLIERCNGVLKARFRCLIKDRTLHYNPEKSSAIINACVVLHNLCITYNVPEYIYEELEENDMGIYQEVENNDVIHNNQQNRYLMLGRQQRNRIVQVLQNRI